MDKFYALIQDKKIINIITLNEPEQSLISALKLQFNADSCIPTNDDPVAGVNGFYDGIKFIPPQPYPSWTLDEETNSWTPPIPWPIAVYESGAICYGCRHTWDESTTSWVEI